jgi:hypothetical protein
MNEAVVQICASRWLFLLSKMICIIQQLLAVVGLAIVTGDVLYIFVTQLTKRFNE